MDKIVNLKDIREKKKASDKRKIQYQGTENEMLNHLKEEFDQTLSEIQKPKKGANKNGITK